ncbi:FAD-dependent oxidoreductase [Hydrogenophaga laconesensis]|uniref:NADH dehydrogenase FAD-containing subunit n=1 Tax=Hydrogenophaga laconesensis TaxID=1805971 RepID=A0ABU1VCC8_9BURK|nr:FAD-dependent oxidoreductase [Hydrogenophaga laconesensis]MDR7095126.1 NADH dehydrogenase FAD-containing subunit [Hydrogenophaga laconesensis]
MHHGIKKLVLLGAGQAHLQVLARLARHHPGNLDVILLTPFPHHTGHGCLPGFVTGQHTADEGRVALEPLVRAARARWLQGRCTGLDATAQQVQITPTGGAQGVPTTLGYDLLSIDIGTQPDRPWLDATMPGATHHALHLHPVEAFIALWPQVMAMAQKQAVSLAVVGAGADGIELVFAAAQGIREHGLPGSRFTLISGGEDIGPDLPAGVRQRVLAQLRHQGITVLREACVGMSEGEVLLGNGARLACDVPLLTMGMRPAAWLQGSGLALNDTGQVLVGPQLQSTSHAQVFATGGVSAQLDGTPGDMHAGTVLAYNLLAAHEGAPLRTLPSKRQRVALLACGTGHAIASWGPLCVGGRWVWEWKDRIDRGFLELHRVTRG